VCSSENCINLSFPGTSTAHQGSQGDLDSEDFESPATEELTKSLFYLDNGQSAQHQY